MKIPDDPSIRGEIIRALSTVRGKERREALKEMAAHFGCSTQTLDAIARSASVPAKRRKDFGSTRYDSAKIDRLHARMIQRDYTAERAIEEAIVSGEMNAEDVPSAGYVYELLRKKHLAVADRKAGLERWDGSIKLTGGIPMEAPAPMDVNHVDFTHVWQMDTEDYDKAIEYHSPLAKSKNKPGGKRRYSMWLYSVVDDCSRYKFAYAYVSHNQFNVMDFVLKAMRPKSTDLFENSPGRPDPWYNAGESAWSDLSSNEAYLAPGMRSLSWLTPKRVPFQGVPKMYYTDNDSALIGSTALFRLAKDKIGFQHWTAMPGHAWCKAKVERVFRIYTPWFLSLPDGLNVYQINLLLQDFVYGLNNKPGRNGMTPTLRWMEGADTIRKMPATEYTKFLLYKPFTKAIDYYYRFRMDGQTFALPRGKKPFNDLCRQSVTIYINIPDLERARKGLADYPEFALMWEDRIHWFPAVPADKDESIAIGTEFKSLPTCDREKELARLEQIDITTNSRQHGYKNELYNNVVFPEPQGEEVQIDYGVQVAEPNRNIYYAIRLFCEAGAISDPVLPEERVWLQENLFVDSEEVPESRIHALLKEVQEGRSVIRKLRIIGGENAEAQAAS